MAGLRWPGGAWAFDRETISLGRGADNVLPLPDPGVSRYHARIARNARGWEVVDNGGENGVFVNGKRVQRQQLRHGDVVQLGSTKLEFVDELDPGETVSLPQFAETVSAQALKAAEVEAGGAGGGARTRTPRRRGSRAPRVIGALVLVGLGAGVTAFVLQSRKAKDAAGAGAGDASVAVYRPSQPTVVTSRPPGPEDIIEVPHTPTPLGVAWHGSLLGGLDFLLESPSDAGDGVTRFRHQSWQRGGAPAHAGAMMIEVHGPRVTMALLDDAEQLVRLYDGIFASDGRSITGQAYAPDELPSTGGTPFWATVEAAPVAAPARLHLASAGAGEVATVLPDRADAWRVVEHRMTAGPLTSLGELDALGLSPASLARLKELADAR
ncbi:MAG: FHA domain-containing protein [Deltaproteobacteria bacterium]|nr:FHA domain-containing protein [Deltaproteobacteria bacterium]